MRRLRPGSLVTVAIAVLALLGHVCTPLVGHVVPAIAHDGGHQHQAPSHHDGHDGDALHAASCDGLRPAPGRAPYVWTCTTVVPTVLAAPRRALTAPRPVAVAANSPPLFLLHAALLI